MVSKFYYRLWFKLISFVALTMFLALTVTSLSYFLFVSSDLSSPPDRNPGMFFVFFIFFSVFLGSILAASIGKWFLKPIYDLNKATKEISKGNFKVRLNTKYKSEIGELNSNFNKMANELQSNQMVHNDFVTNVSHEFNTPLSSILGYTMLLQDEYLSKEERDESLQKIVSSTKRLSKLTSNILNLAKLENQEIITEQKEYSLDEQIRRVILDLEKKWEEKNIELNVDLDDAVIYGESELISQIWFNTLHNAIKFSDIGASIDISLKNYHEEIIVVIKDYGKGMNENTLNHIFDKFFQFENSRSLEGNGLGLSIVKRIADLNNILITTVSSIGNGTKFEFKISKWLKDAFLK